MVSQNYLRNTKILKNALFTFLLFVEAEEVSYRGMKINDLQKISQFEV